MLAGSRQKGSGFLKLSATFLKIKKLQVNWPFFEFVDLMGIGTVIPYPFHDFIEGMNTMIFKTRLGYTDLFFTVLYELKTHWMKKLVTLLPNNCQPRPHRRML